MALFIILPVQFSVYLDFNINLKEYGFHIYKKRKDKYLIFPFFNYNKLIFISPGINAHPFVGKV